MSIYASLCTAIVHRRCLDPFHLSALHYIKSWGRFFQKPQCKLSQIDMTKILYKRNKNDAYQWVYRMEYTVIILTSIFSASHRKWCPSLYLSLPFTIYTARLNSMCRPASVSTFELSSRLSRTGRCNICLPESNTNCVSIIYLVSGYTW